MKLFFNYEKEKEKNPEKVVVRLMNTTKKIFIQSQQKVDTLCLKK